MIYVSRHTFDPRDRVVILGAGPSISLNTKRVRKYCRGACVIATNYNYRIKPDYTLFVNKKSYKKRVNVRGKIIISSDLLEITKKEKLVLKCESDYHVSRVMDISIDDDGSVNHSLGNCGFGAIMLATFFSPKEIVLAGFDGPSQKKMHHFNNFSRRFSKERYVDEKRFMKIILKYLGSSNIRVLSFENDPLWGIRKARYAVKIA